MTNTLLAAAVLLTTATQALAERSVRVLFDSHGQRLVGDLYLPANHTPGTRHPAVVITGAWTTVKEQMPRRYAIELADRGFVALAFDFRHWGQSEGDRRQYENPTLKTEDIVAAAAFLATRPEVDPARIGGLGICASAGYMAGAAAASEHLRSLTLVAPWMHDAEMVERVYGGPEGVAALIAESREADRRFRETGVATMRPAAGAAEESAVMVDAPYYTERDRGLIPEYVNRFNVASWEPWLTYDAVVIADDLDAVPVLIVHSDAAAIPQGVRAFYDRLTGDKREVWLEGVSQFDFYDDDRAVSQASDAVADRLRDTLSAPPASNAADSADAAALKTMIESVATLADRGDFTALGALFADEIAVDYSSLTGEPAEVVSPSALMTRWAGVLPGFDRTRHALTDVRVTVDGDAATGAARVRADHWIGEGFWRVDGHYAYEFERDDQGWRIAAMTFAVENEAGSRDVFGPASQAARAEPNEYLVRQRSRQAVLDFLEGLEEKDMDRVNGVWAEDAVQDMPYSPPGFPKRVVGREALIAHYSEWPENAGEANFTDAIVFYPTLDPQLVIAEWRGLCEIVATGRTYDQRYIGLFHVVDGRIKLFREYYDPTVFAHAFALDTGSDDD